ncbi:YdcH family protein [Dechloromonas sp. ZS-1]|uniref:YdcH family protein n=1 Tax=Dechloromonas sp. ZS-1 TaxID=3138067 RepID=UPI0031FC0DB2
MFPEYRDLITQLKTSDRHFLNLFDKHNELDQKIKNMEAHIEPGTPIEIENLKKEKLALKDELYTHLRKAEGARTEA